MILRTIHTSVSITIHAKLRTDAYLVQPPLRDAFFCLPEEFLSFRHLIIAHNSERLPEVSVRPAKSNAISANKNREWESRQE